MGLPIDNRSRSYSRSVQYDRRSDTARASDIAKVKSKAERGEALTPHEQGLLNNQRLTHSTETKNETTKGIKPEVKNNGVGANVELYKDKFEVEANAAEARAASARRARPSTVRAR
jgi:hypothetical protein